MTFVCTRTPRDRLCMHDHRPAYLRDRMVAPNRDTWQPWKSHHSTHRQSYEVSPESGRAASRAYRYSKTYVLHPDKSNLAPRTCNLTSSLSLRMGIFTSFPRINLRATSHQRKIARIVLPPRSQNSLGMLWPLNKNFATVTYFLRTNVIHWVIQATNRMIRITIHTRVGGAI
jgi:hypothetical protein